MTDRIIAILEGRYPGESFRPCLGSDEDYVGTNGIVWTSFPPGASARIPETIERDGIYVRRLAFTLARGYRTVCVRRGKYRVAADVHVLALEAFVGPCPEGMEACHDPDHDKKNNRIENLRWDTHQSNCDDIERHGRRPKGERSAQAKLAEVDAKEIATLRSQGLSMRAIAERFGVSQAIVSMIIRGKRWRHVEVDPAAKEVVNVGVRLSESDIREIRQFRLQGQTHREIAMKVGCGRSTVSLVVRGKTWRDIDPRERDAASRIPPRRCDQRGSLGSNAKLSEGDAIEIYRRVASGEPPKTVAANYRINQGTVRGICARRRWKHLDLPPLDLVGLLRKRGNIKRQST